MNMAIAGGAGLRIGVLTGTGTRETLKPLCDICLSGIQQLKPEMLKARASLCT